MSYKEVYLNEKDSQVQALAPVLGCRHTQKWKPAYNSDKSIAIVPLQGHVMRLYNADEYDAAYKQWTEDTTLCFPKKFLRKPQERTIQMYNTAVQHLREADKIIIATDFDNEGAALAMEVIEAAGCEHKVEYMLHMGSMNEDALRQALKDKTPIPYKEMAEAGFGRANIDWAEGMSLTRALTIHLARKKLMINFGGVKSPLINMVVERDLQFESHNALKYWTLNGTATANGKSFEYSLFRRINGKKEVKFEKEEFANEIMAKTEKLDNIIVNSIKRTLKKENPSSLYTQTELQGDVSDKYKLEPIQTLAVAQKFYIEDKVSTYPRTEIDAIHEKEYKDVPIILGRLKELMHTEIIENILSKAIIKRPSVFDSKKVTSHGAIVPTTETKIVSKVQGLKDLEQKIFKLIAERYIENFLPPYEYTNVDGEAHLFDDVYISFTENIPESAGFKVIKDDKINEKISSYQPNLPKDMKKGDEISITNINKKEGKSKPKPRFTNKTLLTAMAKVANLYPEDKLIKEMLGENGIGTGATRAVILDQLFETKDKKGNPIEPWFIKKGAQIISTEKARKFIKVMPKEIVSPIRRAKLQAELNKIERGEISITDFLEKAKENLINDIGQIKEFAKDPKNIIAAPKKEVVSLGECPVCKEGSIYENGKVYMCSGADWSNKGTKETPEWKNEGCDYKIFKNSLERFGKPNLGKLEVKKLLETQKIKVKLKSKGKQLDYEKDIIIDEKYGIKVIF